jgi:hypothetical protein
MTATILILSYTYLIVRWLLKEACNASIIEDEEMAM